MNIIPVNEDLHNAPHLDEFRLGKSSGSRANKLMPAGMPIKDTVIMFAESKGYKTTELAPTKADPSKVKQLSIEAITSQFTYSDIGELKALDSKKDEFYRLVAEKVARPITPNDYTDRLPEGHEFSMMARGHLLESEAIAAFEEKTGLKTLKRSVIWQSSDNPESILSPDAEIDGANEAVEVKAPDSHVIVRAYHENAFPKEYHWQRIKYFVTNEKLEKLYSVLYTDVMPALPIMIFELTREEVQEDIEQFRAFENSILIQANKLVEELSF